MNQTPSSNGANGNGGRFAKGNPGGPGNPFAKRVAELRAAMFEAVTPEDLKSVVASLLAQAKRGDVASIRELLQRVLGPPESVDLLERLAAMEAKIEQLAEDKSWRH
jgi:hypothetical protein